MTGDLIEHILTRLPRLTIGVFGDVFLDRYLDLDAGLTEPSIETGLDAYQVVRVRAVPGAAGTVINNLAALGVGRICPVALVGDDGEGYELRQALDRLRVVDASGLHARADRRTPTYTKPLLFRPGEPPRELNRIDIKNRTPLPRDAEDRLWESLTRLWPDLDALLVLDQVSEPDCGVVTRSARERLADLGARHPDRLILADSREFIGQFRSVSIKPNAGECVRATGGDEADVGAAVTRMAKMTGRPVFCTNGPEGILLAESGSDNAVAIPGYPVSGPTDTVGAGDSTSAGIACALAAGTTPQQAAAFGNLVASITVRQIGTTGTASPDQVRQRWNEVRSEEP